MFLAHFMGDVHQPLHVGFTSDAGGNSITVYWYTVKTNLHSVSENILFLFIKKITKAMIKGQKSIYFCTSKTNTVYIFLLKVWDTKIIKSAMTNYYGNDHNTMADSINANITVCELVIFLFLLWCDTLYNVGAQVHP